MVVGGEIISVTVDGKTFNVDSGDSNHNKSKYKAECFYLVKIEEFDDIELMFCNKVDDFMEFGSSKSHRPEDLYYVCPKEISLIQLTAL